MSHADRHTRESAARAGAISGISREMVRRFNVVRQTYGPDVADRVTAGELSLHRLHAEAIGDRRVGLFVKIPAELRDAIRRVAEMAGVSMTELLTETLTQLFGESIAEGDRQ